MSGPFDTVLYRKIFLFLFEIMVFFYYSSKCDIYGLFYAGLRKVKKIIAENYSNSVVRLHLTKLSVRVEFRYTVENNMKNLCCFIGRVCVPHFFQLFSIPENESKLFHIIILGFLFFFVYYYYVFLLYSFRIRKLAAGYCHATLEIQHNHLSNGFIFFYDPHRRVFIIYTGRVIKWESFFFTDLLMKFFTDFWKIY
jgi:hypothetical protein